MSAEFEVADRFYFDMLARECVAAKEPDAVPHLRKLLRLRSIAETPIAGPMDPLTKQHEKHFKLELALTHRLTDYEIRLEGETGEVISWYLDFLSVEGDDTMSRDDAIKAATTIAAPPADTTLVHADYETMADRTVFRARWSHTHDGLVVDGDFLEVLLNGKARMPFAHTRRYHVPKISPQGPKP